MSKSNTFGSAGRRPEYSRFARNPGVHLLEDRQGHQLAKRDLLFVRQLQVAAAGL